MLLNKGHIFLGSVLALPFLFVLWIYFSLWHLQPLYVYNPLPVRYPLAKNLFNTDKTFSIPKFYSNLESFIQNLKKHKYKDYDIDIRRFRLIFSANYTDKITPLQGDAFFFFEKNLSYEEEPKHGWNQDIQFDFHEQTLLYNPPFLYIIFYDTKHMGTGSFVSPEIVHPKRDIMTEAEALGGKAFRQTYCKRDCRIFVGIEDHHHEPNFENELPDKIRNEWGLPLAQVHYKSPEGPFFTVWFLYAGKTWVIDSSLKPKQVLPVLPQSSVSK